MKTITKTKNTNTYNSSLPRRIRRAMMSYWNRNPRLAACENRKLLEKLVSVQKETIEINTGKVEEYHTFVLFF